MTTPSWFDVDRQGLAKLVERRGKVFILHELLQNCWDLDGARTVNVTLTPVDGRALAQLTVEDDHPEGFRDLSHAYTLFAESEKKGDPTKRGRFNFGEKLALALCESAEVESTTGTVHFDKEGRRVSRHKRAAGTAFRALVRMTRAELDDVLVAVRDVLPPVIVRTVVNGELLVKPLSLATVSAKLATEISDSEGILRRVTRETTVSIYPANGKPMLYEMGIPVMELTDDAYSVDIGQKVPLTMERDAVLPSYLRDVRVVVMNRMAAQLTAVQAAGKWAAEALEKAKPEAVQAVIEARFGKKTVIADPSDREGEDIAKSRGYTVIPGGTFSREAWENIRFSGVVRPAGQVTPSPKPFTDGGKPLKMMETPTEACKRFEKLTIKLGKELLGIDYTVVCFVNDRGWGFLGTFNRGGILNVNYAKLKTEIEMWDLPSLLSFVVHEFAHYYESNHLAEGFHEACCTLAGKLARLALTSPRLFQLTKSQTSSDVQD